MWTVVARAWTSDLPITIPEHRALPTGRQLPTFYRLILWCVHLALHLIFLMYCTLLWLKWPCFILQHDNALTLMPCCLNMQLKLPFHFMPVGSPSTLHTHATHPLNSCTTRWTHTQWRKFHDFMIEMTLFYITAQECNLTWICTCLNMQLKLPCHFMPVVFQG